MTKRKIIKGIIMMIYTICMYTVWINYMKPNMIAPTSFLEVTNALLSIALTIIIIMVWGLITFQLLSNFIQRYTIQKKLNNAEQSLDVIANAKLLSYKPSNKGNYITLRFRSNGAHAELWEEKRKAVQSVINYTILGEIEHDKKHWDIVIVKVKKGRSYANDNELNDEL